MEDKRLRTFFTNPLENFDIARATFSSFLRLLFDKVSEILLEKPLLKNPRAWRDWLESTIKEDGREIRRRDVVYDEVVQLWKQSVCQLTCYGDKNADTNHSQDLLSEINRLDSPKLSEVSRASCSECQRQTLHRKPAFHDHEFGAQPNG